jgi:HAD superfamily phosphatase (TIGR01668 family)
MTPKSFFSDIYEITPEFLKEKGIRAIVSDIDNTLVTYDDAKPTERLLEWFSAMQDAGIKIAFISNNSGERVRIFNEELGYHYFPNAKKPLIKTMLKAIDTLGEGKEHTAALGDQILTDIVAGNRAGIYTILVPPINDKRDIFTRFKRLLERPIIRKYEKRNNK